MKRFNCLSIGLAAAIVTASASAQWSAPDEPREPVTPTESIRASASDPVGDNFNPGPDLTGISGETDGTTLFLTLTFADTISPPPAIGPGPGPTGDDPGGNEVVGFIELDIDQDGGTGTASGPIFQFCPQPPANFGSEFLVDLGNYDPQTGTVALEPIGIVPKGVETPVPITYTSNSLTVEVPNSAIGDDGIVDAVTVIGNLPAPTDCAPDGGVLSTDRGLPRAESVPAMSATGLAVLCLVMLLTGLVVRRSF